MTPKMDNSNLRKAHLANPFGSIIGYTAEIHLAVLKDEIVELQSRLQRTETGYLIPTISTLQQRVREMEKKKYGKL